jgi:hypothetical protein
MYFLRLNIEETGILTYHAAYAQRVQSCPYVLEVSASSYSRLHLAVNQTGL